MSVNGVYIVLGEANTIVALLNKARRQYQLSHQPPSLEDTDPLLRNFADLKDVLNQVADITDMNPLTYLSPFLDVIKAQNTNGPITEAALSSVGKFLCYGLIDANSMKASHAVEEIATSVVHTKFIGGKSSGSDECVLYKILHVLRCLLLSPPGRLLSNESVCDMMQSCFRIVFEQHLSPLLRKAAEATLTDMTQLIFTRLPTFGEDVRHPYMRKLVMNSKGEKRQRRRKRASATKPDDSDAEDEDLNVSRGTKVEGSITQNTTVVNDMTSPDKTPEVVSNTGADTAINLGYDVVGVPGEKGLGSVVSSSAPQNRSEDRMVEAEDRAVDADSESENADNKNQENILHSSETIGDADAEDLTTTSQDTIQMPYGLPCCRELLRFLIALTNPLDRQNTESMVVLGLNLLTVAFEAAADYLAGYSFLMPLIKDNLCRSLLQLLDTEKLPVLAATNRCCFLLFESMRNNLKFQLESYFHKLRGIVLSEQRNIVYEQKEMALESIVQLWRIPGLVTELYLNYDCDLYCSNLFEDLTKLLAENAFPVSGMHSSSLLSLDALLIVIETIDQNCVCRQTGAFPLDESATRGSTNLVLPVLSGFEIGKKIIERDGSSTVETTPDLMVQAQVELRSNRHASSVLPSMSDVIDQKNRKRIFAEGTDLFNKSPKKGIEFLRNKGLLGQDADSVVAWLRANPQLDKRMIADYICSRKHADVLEAFVRSFPFENTRLDESLRLFLETFRLPGEAAEISMVMQQFSDQWYRANNEPFNHKDAAFTLSYAIIMLNTDQHNPTVRRNQPPMTIDCFKRNLSGTNDGQDFPHEMLEMIYHAIKTDEIVMPAEQTGLVKENYLWKVLLRRGETQEGRFVHAPAGWNDCDLFALAWGPAIAALSYVFDKSGHDVILKRALNGYRKCASIAAHYGMTDVFDNLVIHLCKFSTLGAHTDGSMETEHELHRQRSMNEPTLLDTPEGVAIAFGGNPKAHEASKALFELVHKHGDILREGWRNVLDVLLQLFRSHLLPPDMTEVDDFVDEKGWVSIVRHHARTEPVRNESGILFWLGLGGGASETEKKRPTQEQLSFVKAAGNVIVECRPLALFGESKYLTNTAVSELVQALCGASRAIVDAVDAKIQGSPVTAEHEDAMVFFLELIITVSLENKDRLSIVWPTVQRHLEWLLSPRFGRSPVLVERAVVGILRVANRNLFRDNTVADDVLQSLSILLHLSPKALFILSRQIAFGLHELIRNNAANVHKKEHWAVLFSLLEAAGAALLPDDYRHEQTAMPENKRNAFSDSEQASVKTLTDDRGYTSDEPGERRRAAGYASSETVSMGSGADSALSLNQSREWIHLDHKDAAKATQDALRTLSDSRTAFARGSLVLSTNLGRHEPAAFLKVCDCVAFLLRDAIHVTPDNFDSCVQCLRTMVEASLDGGRYAAGPLSGDAQNHLRSNVEERQKRAKNLAKTGKKELSTDVSAEDDVKEEEQQLSTSYQQASLQLLDLCSTLHNVAPTILKKWAETGETAVDASVPFVWKSVWRPLLQAMGRLACDCRRQIRATALSHLQRAFLPSNMADLGPDEWESCFGEVLFPLLGKLLEPFSAMDTIGMEDTRVRALQIVVKTLLNHLKTLSSLPSFSALWLRLLDFMEQYLRVDNCQNLNEAVPESLKNMLLVMDNTGLFGSVPGLYDVTVSRMGNVFPQLIRDTIPNPPAPVAALPTPASGSSLANLPSSNRLGRVQIAAPIPSSTVHDEALNTATALTTASTVTSVEDVAAPPNSVVESIMPPSSMLEQATPPEQNSDNASRDLIQNSVPVEIPELTEVVVWSAASSPIAQSPPIAAPAVQQNTAPSHAGSYASATCAPPNAEQQRYAAAPVTHPVQSYPYYQPPVASYHAVEEHHYITPSTSGFPNQQQIQQTSQHNPTYTGAPAAMYSGPPQTANPYENQMSQHQSQPYMPEADLAKAFATHVPQFVPPSELLASLSSQHSVANPLSMPSHGPPVQLNTSVNSAFTHFSSPPREQIGRNRKRKLALRQQNCAPAVVVRARLIDVAPLESGVDDSSKCSVAATNANPTDAGKKYDSAMCGLTDLVSSCLSKPKCDKETRPFLWASMFTGVPPTIRFYTKGTKVSKPNQKVRGRLLWLHNSLLPIVMRRSLAASHFTVVDGGYYVGYWGRHLKSTEYKELLPYQKVNHYPGNFHIGRKDRLWTHVNRHRDRFGDGVFDIVPITYILPNERKELERYLKDSPKNHVIIKPPASARGAGILVTRRLSDIPHKTPLVAQHYINHPLTINGAKFDLRLYAYVPSLEPLRIYIYNEGLVRFASVPFRGCVTSILRDTVRRDIEKAWQMLAHVGEGCCGQWLSLIVNMSEKNRYSSCLTTVSNKYMHLTNYSINKLAEQDGVSDSPVPKWTLTDLWQYFAERGINGMEIQDRIEEVIIKGFIACQKPVRDHMSKHIKHAFVCHELFGVDILLDEDLRPWLLEVNISPSLHSGTPLDVSVKAPLAKDVLNLAGVYVPPDQNSPSKYSWATRPREWPKADEDIEKAARFERQFKDEMYLNPEITQHLTPEDCRTLVEFEDEYRRRGNFRLVFPTAETVHMQDLFIDPLGANLMLQQWQLDQSEDRAKGIERLEELCKDGYMGNDEPV